MSIRARLDRLEDKIRPDRPHLELFVVVYLQDDTEDPDAPAPPRQTLRITPGHTEVVG